MSTAEAAPPSSPPRRLTPADLLALPNETDFELVDGQLLELSNMGYESNRVAAILLILLGMHCRQRKLGDVLGSELGYQCFTDDPDRIRKPDVSFIRIERLRGADMSGGYCRLAPDLAVEVISPNDLALELSKKVKEYLAAGVQLVWVLDPESQRVSVYRRSGGATILSQQEELTGEDVVPGFRCQVSELFAPTPGLV